MKIQKNRILFALLTVCVATVCALSGTVAKYTAGASGQDSATVSKWGITVQMSGSLFGKSYTYGANGNPIASAGESQLIVRTSGEMNVIAPGTTGNRLQLRMSGVAEVDAVMKTDIRIRNVFLKAGTYGTVSSLGLGSTLSDVTFAELVSDGTLLIKNGTGYQKVTTASKAADVEYFLLRNKVTVGKDYYPVQFHSQGQDQNGNPMPDVSVGGNTITADFNKNYHLAYSNSHIDS